LILPYKHDKIPLFRFPIPLFQHSIIPGWKKKNGWVAIPYYQAFLEIPIYLIEPQFKFLAGLRLRLRRKKYLRSTFLTKKYGKKMAGGETPPVLPLPGHEGIFCQGRGEVSSPANGDH